MWRDETGLLTSNACVRVLRSCTAKVSKERVIVGHAWGGEKKRKKREPASACAGGCSERRGDGYIHPMQLTSLGSRG